ncbi:MAG: undecaprenyl-diphosphatase [Alcanivorax borkumensis]
MRFCALHDTPAAVIKNSPFNQQFVAFRVDTEPMMTTKPTFQRMTAADTRAMCWLLQQPQAARRARLARMVSRFGDGPFYVALTLCIWGMDRQGGSEFALTAMVAYALEMPLFVLLKHLIKRPRPADALESLSAFIQPADRFSFPSGHTAAAFVMASLLCVFYPPVIALALGLALMVGLSRVLLGVHYPSDIFAGAALGFGCAMIGLWLV